MLGQTTNASSRKHVFATIIVGFALVTVIGQIAVSATHGCNLLNGNGWVLSTILRPIFLAACHSIHLTENSICSTSMPQIASSASSMLSGLAGIA